MKIEKAIEILIAYKAGSYEDTGPDLDDALTLGTEALKAFVEGRTKPGGMFFHDLPGETED